MVRATIDRDEAMESLGVIAQLWEEACSEGLRQDADRYRQAMIRIERRSRGEVGPCPARDKLTSPQR